MTPQESLPRTSQAKNPHSSKESITAQYTQYVAMQKLKEDIEATRKKMKEFLENEKKYKNDNFPQTVPEFAEITELATGGGLIPAKHGHFNVGIVGAGVAGLFTALVLDWINDSIKTHIGPGHLEIKYEILEATSKERFGGRLYTHRFSKDGLHDYYDVGAMRFPENTVMDRTFRLFDMLDIKKGELGDRTDVNDPPVLIPYYLEDDNNVCPTYFNDVKKVGTPWNDQTVDPFRLNNGIAQDNQIPEKLTKAKPSNLFKTAIQEFLDHVNKKYEAYKRNSDEKESKEEKELWDLLMKADQMSVRQFLLSKENPKPIPAGPGYSYNTIQWIETATYGTGWYDQSLTEAVLESLDFDVPDEKNANKHWFCIDGGAQKIAETMRKKMKDPSVIKYNTQVVGMDANLRLYDRVTREMQLNIKDTASGESLESKRYFTVFNSTTLGSMNRMDLSKAGLLWDTKQAIRCLGYGASCKVGIKFKSPWWRKAPYNITKGGVAHTDLPLQVCVYPSYNIDNDLDPLDKPAVLLVSYTWGQTAQRLATLIASKSANKPNEEILREETELKNVLLRDLAFLHAEDPQSKKNVKKTLDLISGEYVEHHAYDWYHDPNMAGAFAYFGPCQFKELYPAITKPNAFGQLYFVGEAASAHHAWVVGALESVIRAVWLMFNSLHQGSKDDPALEGGKGYKPYEWAMQLLKCGRVKDGKNIIPLSAQKLPFYPLPAEMPERWDSECECAKPGAPGGSSDPGELLDHPEIGREGDISYGAAIVAMSLVDLVLDEWLKPNVEVKLPPQRA